MFICYLLAWNYLDIDQNQLGATPETLSVFLPKTQFVPFKPFTINSFDDGQSRRDERSFLK
ncbi:hypothetical protein L9G16_13885 [Shewanella sp. A25]|nr:hypothetical protein [Shewanella shenzhenensis]